MTVDPESPTHRHPIGVAAERTGLSLDVLRVWERRYGAVAPGRATGGQRLYSDADLERLRLLRLATLAGRGIGQVATLGTAELAELVREDEAARRRNGSWEPAVAAAPAEHDIQRALAFTRALDGLALEGLLRRSVAVLGMAVFLDALAEPLLRRVDEEREAGRLSTAQERLATLTVRRLLDGAVLSLAVPGGAPHLLVATPAGERRELEALLVAAAAAVEGWRVTYLGPDLSADEIAGAAAGTAAQAVGVSVSHTVRRESLMDELRRLRAALPPIVPLLVGVGAHGLATELESAGIHVVEDLAHVRAALRNAGGRPSPSRG
jgi:DNA-binding transcriptional MerR regulator/methylmalonyl-CoA mutase cobalamin-binding subunit